MVLFRRPSLPRSTARPRVTARPNLRPAFNHIRPRLPRWRPTGRLSPRLLRILARVARATTAAGRAAILAAEGVTAAEAAIVLAAAGLAYGTYKGAQYVARNKQTWIDDARKDGHVPGAPAPNRFTAQKVPKPAPPTTPASGNKRPLRPEEYWGDQDERPAKRPGNPVHHGDWWFNQDNPMDPEDPELPEYRDIPGPGTSWSGNNGAHNHARSQHGDGPCCARSAPCIGSSSLRATRPAHNTRFLLCYARGRCRVGRTRSLARGLAAHTRACASKRDAPALSAAPQASCASTARRSQPARA